MSDFSYLTGILFNFSLFLKLTYNKEDYNIQTTQFPHVEVNKRQ